MGCSNTKQVQTKEPKPGGEEIAKTSPDGNGDVTGSENADTEKSAQAKPADDAANGATDNAVQQADSGADTE